MRKHKKKRKINDKGDNSLSMIQEKKRKVGNKILGENDKEH